VVKAIVIDPIERQIAHYTYHIGLFMLESK